MGVSIADTLSPSPVSVTSSRTTVSELNVRGHIRELDGLRAIAVVLVLLIHFGPYRQQGSLLSNMESIGWMGVDLFFVLSGFLITGLLIDAKEKPNYYRNFYTRRIFRIFPLYYALLLGGSLIYIVGHIGSRHEFVHKVWWYFLYLGNFWPEFGASLPLFLAPLWSLQIEEQFYLIFPFLVRNLNPTRLFKILVGVIIFSGPLRLAVYLWKPGLPLLEYVLLPLRLDGLAIGALIALRSRQGSWRIRPGRLTILMVTTMSALWAYSAWGGYYSLTGRMATFGYSVVALAFGVFLIWVLRFREARPTAWLRTGPLQYLGKISYGIYVLQVPAYFIVKEIGIRFGWPRFQPSTWHVSSWGGFVSVFTLTVLAASASWYFLERPISKAKERWAKASQMQETGVQRGSGSETQGLSIQSSS